MANGDVLGDDVKTWVEDSGVVEDLLLQVCTPDFLHHLKNLGVSAIYIGPLFHSKSHGYDTTDFFCLDSRLGSSNKTLRHVIRTYQQHGFRVILDAVFNHVGREFWAFRDVRINCEKSNYVHWFYTSFDHSTKQKRHHFGDPFAYEGWAGCYDLVKLNLQNPEVVRHLLAATRFWIDDLGIDGLRLDAADCIPTDFWRLLRRFVSGSWDTRNLQYDNKSCDEFFLNDIPTGPLNGSSDILLLGEITHGSYRKWVCPKTVFHSVTNYEMWSSLWSSVVNGNMFELGHTLERQWRHEKASEFDKLISKTSSNRPGYAATPDYLWLYTFLDNHDVDRIASKLSPPALQTSIFLSFALPGVPSIYYGSEFGLTGTKGTGPAADYRLRPKLEASYISQAVHSSACPEEWESQNWEIYCLYKQMGQLYVHPLINYVFSNGGYYLFHLSSVSLGFVRFSDILNSKLSDHRVVILVCVSLGSSNISVPIKILQELTGETNFEFVDVFRPSDVPSVVKLDDQKIQIRVDHMACLIVGHDIDSVKKTLPPAVWSLEILQQQTVTGKLKSDAQVELLQWDQSKSPHEDGNENFNENRKRRSGSSDLLILEDLEWTWSSTFKDFNLCDIGQNSSRLFDSRYVKHVLNIGTCLYQVWDLSRTRRCTWSQN